MRNLTLAWVAGKGTLCGVLMLHLVMVGLPAGATAGQQQEPARLDGRAPRLLGQQQAAGFPLVNDCDLREKDLAPALRLLEKYRNNVGHQDAIRKAWDLRGALFREREALDAQYDKLIRDTAVGAVSSTLMGALSDILQNSTIVRLKLRDSLAVVPMNRLAEHKMALNNAELMVKNFPKLLETGQSSYSLVREMLRQEQSLQGYIDTITRSELYDSLLQQGATDLLAWGAVRASYSLPMAKLAFSMGVFGINYSAIVGRQISAIDESSQNAVVLADLLSREDDLEDAVCENYVRLKIGGWNFSLFDASELSLMDRDCEPIEQIFRRDGSNFQCTGVEPVQRATNSVRSAPAPAETESSAVEPAETGGIGGAIKTGLILGGVGVAIGVGANAYTQLQDLGAGGTGSCISTRSCIVNSFSGGCSCSGTTNGPCDYPKTPGGVGASCVGGAPCRSGLQCTNGRCEAPGTRCP